MRQLPNRIETEMTIAIPIVALPLGMKLSPSVRAPSERHGLRNRGQVLENHNSARELLKLFQERREAVPQQMT